MEEVSHNTYKKKNEDVSLKPKKILLKKLQGNRMDPGKLEGGENG